MFLISVIVYTALMRFLCKGSLFFHRHLLTYFFVHFLDKTFPWVEEAEVEPIRRDLYWACSAFIRLLATFFLDLIWPSMWSASLKAPGAVKRYLCAISKGTLSEIPYTASVFSDPFYSMETRIENTKFYTKHCFHAHNNGIIEGIYRIDRVWNIIDILPSRRLYQSSRGHPVVMGLPKMLWNQEKYLRYTRHRLFGIYLRRYHYYVFWKHCF